MIQRTQTAAVCNAIDYKTFPLRCMFCFTLSSFFIIIIIIIIIFIIFEQSNRSCWWLKSFENESDKMCNTLRLVDSNVNIMYTNFCRITMPSNSFCRLNYLHCIVCITLKFVLLLPTFQLNMFKTVIT